MRLDHLLSKELLNISSSGLCSVVVFQLLLVYWRLGRMGVRFVVDLVLLTGCLFGSGFLFSLLF